MSIYDVVKDQIVARDHRIVGFWLNFAWRFLVNVKFTSLNAVTFELPPITFVSDKLQILDLYVAFLVLVADF